MPSAYGYRADLYLYIGEHDKAIEGYNMELKFRPNYAEIYFDRGTVYVKKGEV